LECRVLPPLPNSYARINVGCYTVTKQRNGDYQVPSGGMQKSFLCMIMITFVSDASP